MSTAPVFSEMQGDTIAIENNSKNYKLFFYVDQDSR